MGGFFGAACKGDAISDVFFGTDYHSHLGTRRAGMAAYDKDLGLQRDIHNIENSPFRTKFENVFEEMKGNSAIGCISDSDPQPLLVRSNLGTYAICIVGVINNAERRYNESSSEYSRGEIEQLMNIEDCPECGGARLKKESLCVTVGGINIYEFSKKSIKDALSFLDSLKLSERDMMIADLIIKEIRDRMSFLSSVGLEYLSLSRSSGTLSGGESQRIRLATQIGSSLMGVLYILDEPSIGLHQKDNAKLLDTLRHLCDIGNTLIVVEHDEETIMAADYIVDIGPGAGIHGGEIVCSGTLDDIVACENSLTGQYISGKKKIAVPETR